MNFSLKKKLKRAGALLMATAMAAGLFQMVPGNVIVAKADNTVDGYTVSAPAADVTYTFDFINENKVSPNQGTYGLFSFDAGSKNAASKRTDQYGVEFKEGNKLTFQVAGNAYVVVAGDNNSNADLTATSETGTIKNPVQSSKKSGYCAMADCLAMGGNAVVFEYAGPAGSVTITVGATKAYINSACVIPIPALTSSAMVETQLWDFSAAAATKKGMVNYTNKFTNDSLAAMQLNGGAIAKETNAWGDLTWVSNTSDRYYSTVNTTASYKGATNVTTSDGTGLVITSFINPNGANDNAYDVMTNRYFVMKNCKAGDKIALYVGSTNNTSGTMHFALMGSGNATAPQSEATIAFSVEKAQSHGGGDAAYVEYTAPKDGDYRFWADTVEPIYANVMRTPKTGVTVSGSITLPGSVTESACELTFANKQTGESSTVKPSGGRYSITLPFGYDYEVTMTPADIVISDGGAVSVSNATATDGVVTHNIVTLAVIKANVSGKITGLGGKLDKAAISFVPPQDNPYRPVMTVQSDGTYALQAEKGVTYTLVAEGVNDYEFAGETTFTANEDTATFDIAMKEKAKYAVAIEPEGIDRAALANAVFAFTNVNEEGYTYSFTGMENIALRDGTYSVTVDSENATQKLTSYLKIDAAAVTKKIGFQPGVTAWNFSDPAFAGKVGKTAGAGTYYGLTYTNAANNKDQYLLASAGSKISVPVTKNVKVIVRAYYKYSFYFEDEQEPSVGQGPDKGITEYSYIYRGEAGMLDITVKGESYFTGIELVPVVEYKDTVTVGGTGCDYATVNEALSAIGRMERTGSDGTIKRVLVLIQPGNYEEMLRVTAPNVTLKNASPNPSLELKDKGVNIADGAVRITSYYGHGYSYYSMNGSWLYDEEVLAVNKENRFNSVVNPGAGSEKTMWNATAIISAQGFEAEGIIFENSFNQYISEKESNDILIKESGAKEGSVGRAQMRAGDVTVQNKAYVERAAALAIGNNVDGVIFRSCKIIGRQDTLYGGTGSDVIFEKCSIYGATDYIFGAMIALFEKCDLVFNTSDDANDIGYITAPQQKSGRGYFMNECTVTSTTPGQDTASKHTSKPGYLGRPWEANTSEVIFYNTTIEGTDFYKTASGLAGQSEKVSLIVEEAWSASLSGQSTRMVEYGTVEKAAKVYRLAGQTAIPAADKQRINWAQVVTSPKYTYNGEEIALSVKSFINQNVFGSMITGETLNTRVNDSGAKEMLASVAADPSVYEDPAALTAAVTGLRTFVGYVLSRRWQDKLNDLTTMVQTLMKLAAVPPTEPGENESTTATESATQRPSESQTQASSESATQRPSESQTQASSESQTQRPSESATQPVQKPSESATQPVQKPSESATQPMQKPTEATRPGSHKYEVGAISSEVLTDKVQTVTGCKTVAQLTAHLQNAITQNAQAGAVLSGVPAANTSVVEVAVKILGDNGQWVAANEQNFPKVGIDVVLPYPEGINADQFDFVVGHLIVLGCNGKVPGTMEYYKPTKTRDGLKIHIDSASPFVIGWKAVQPAAPSESGALAPGTGDISRILAYEGLLAASAGVVLALISIRKRRKRRAD